MQLNELRDNEGATEARKRVGRGIGSGLGKTAGRGHKGQKARSGVAIKGFEGGQMPIHMRLPKRGFNNPLRLKFSEVNLERLQRAIDDGKLDAGNLIDAKAMIAAGVLRRERDGVRLLGRGELKAKISLEVAGATASALKAVEAAGGSVKLLKLVKETDPTERRPKKGKKAAAAKGE
jgi:large subunit ribosomal protein L15